MAAAGQHVKPQRSDNDLTYPSEINLGVCGNGHKLNKTGMAFD